MATNLKNINSFILNSYIDEINDFLGEKLIEHVDESTAIKHDSDGVYELLMKLSRQICYIRPCSCYRKCPFRKGIK